MRFGVIKFGHDTYQGLNMLKNQRVRVVQFVHRYVNHQVFFGEGHVLVHLQWH